jgi:hypothetical protein
LLDGGARLIHRDALRQPLINPSGFSSPSGPLLAFESLDGCQRIPNTRHAATGTPHPSRCDDRHNPSCLPHFLSHLSPFLGHSCAPSSIQRPINSTSARPS